MAETQLVTFGKYKGKPVEMLLGDADYARWLAAQDWFQTQFITLYKLIQERLHLDEDSPEHNAMQLRWLNPVLLSRLLFAVYGSGTKEQQLECDGKDVCDVVPEKYGWDLRFTWSSWKHGTSCYVELKLTMGDDYPSVLRSLDSKKRKDEPEADYFLVVGSLSSSVADEEALYDFFGRHKINLIFEDEVHLGTTG